MCRYPSRAWPGRKGRTSSAAVQGAAGLNVQSRSIVELGKSILRTGKALPLGSKPEMEKGDTSPADKPEQRHRHAATHKSLEIRTV